MIVTTCGTAGKSKDRFVRKDRSKEDSYVWCERDPKIKSRDTAQGTCNGVDLPKAIRATCEKHYGVFYACAWPYKKEGKPMKSQILMSSGTEAGLIECLKAYWPGSVPTLQGSEWPKGVSNGVQVVEGLQAVKKGKKHIRFQIVRVSV